MADPTKDDVKRMGRETLDEGRIELGRKGEELKKDEKEMKKESGEDPAFRPGMGRKTTDSEDPQRSWKESKDEPFKKTGTE